VCLLIFTHQTQKKTKRTKQKYLADLIPDAKLRERIVAHLYSKKPLLSEGSVFSELLPPFVKNTDLHWLMLHVAKVKSG
jgi:hypothetical protein